MNHETRRYPTQAEFERLFETERPMQKLVKALKRLTGARSASASVGVQCPACWHALGSKSG